MIICVIGLDGSGKTSHLTLLSNALKRNGFRCKCFHLHGAVFRMLSLPMLSLCRKLGYRDEAGHPLVQSNKAIVSVWPWCFFMDFLIFFFGMTFPSFRRRNVVWLFDRYIYDAVVDLMVATGDQTFHKRMASRLFLPIFPKPNVTVLLDVDAETALRRKIHQESHTLNYLKKRRSFYLKLGEELGLPIVSATKPFNEVHCSLVKAIRDKGITIL